MQEQDSPKISTEKGIAYLCMRLCVRSIRCACRSHTSLQPCMARTSEGSGARARGEVGGAGGRGGGLNMSIRMTCVSNKRLDF